MNSIEKVHLALEQLADLDDQDLQEALPVPVPPMMVRGVLPFVADAIPENAGELDQFLTDVGNFCHSLRSDHEPAPAA